MTPTIDSGEARSWRLEPQQFGNHSADMAVAAKQQAGTVARYSLIESYGERQRAGLFFQLA
ncbi:MAG: hypothetical protein QE284_08460 [Rhizobium sp.]|nr:hypothetical protein [Rhizobium sp.]